MSNRKYLRLAIPARLVDKFDQAKKDLEAETAMTMSDAQFATSIITWAIENRVKGRGDQHEAKD